MKKQVETVNLASAVTNYLDTVKMSRSEHTARAYKNALNIFQAVLIEQWLDPQTTPAEKLTEDMVSHFAVYLKNFSPATERLYLQSVTGFYRYVAAERLADINLPRMDLLIKQRKRKAGIRLPQFPADDIERILAYVKAPASLLPAEQGKVQLNARLRALRDRAFLLTLADTGLRVHEACKLRRGDVDWNEGRAIIIGKGDKQAVVRFSTRSIKALKDYLSLRAQLDGGSGKQLTALPLFARHDKGAGKKIKPITTTTGRNIVAERVKQILGEDATGKITPHSFRHYFVTTVLRGSGNLKLAQDLARHANIQVTQRYAHLNDDELDKGYYNIFEGKEKE
ncbi:MAG: tyrosine-type recombinase/integrase [Anaerolineales bacterium]|nr:tyrosine-type recombinase/integrase [Anaerolineales bacterium]